MADHYDALEARDPALREAQQMAALATQVANAKAHAPHFSRLLADVDPADVTSRAALARLPITRKSDLMALQHAAPPFGGMRRAGAAAPTAQGAVHECGGIGGLGRTDGGVSGRGPEPAAGVGPAPRGARCTGSICRVITPSPFSARVRSDFRSRCSRPRWAPA